MDQISVHIRWKADRGESDTVLHKAAHHANWCMRFVRDLSSLRQSLVREAPDLAVLYAGPSDIPASGDTTGRIASEISWLRAHHPDLPVAVVTHKRDARTENAYLDIGAAVVIPYEDLVQRVAEINLCLNYTVLLALPDVLSDIVGHGADQVNSSGSCLSVFVPDDHADLISICTNAVSSGDWRLREIGRPYISTGATRALVVGTNTRSDAGIAWPTKGDRIIIFGRAIEDEPIDLPAYGFWLATQGFDQQRIKYLIAEAALAGGAGLGFHKTIDGCLLDYCFDKLDLTRGLTAGKLCTSCTARLARTPMAGGARLTPVQTGVVTDLLDTMYKDSTYHHPKVPAIKAHVPRKLEKGLAENLGRVAASAEGHFDEYSSRERVIGPGRSLFWPMRHYNSHTPTIPGARAFSRRSNIDTPHHYVGGGYFLVHAGFGIAVDPGHNFLRLLYDRRHPASPGMASQEHGYSVEDIDLVIITHNHWDHHADLETILRCRRGRKLHVYCNKDIMELYKLEMLQDHTDIGIVELDAPSTLALPTELASAFSISRLPALHWQHTYGYRVGTDSLARVSSHLQCFGLKIELLGDMETKPEDQLRKIIITGDTLCPVEKASEIAEASFDPYIKPKHWSRLLMNRQAWADKACLQALRKAYQSFCTCYADQTADLLCAHIGTLEKGKWEEGADAAAVVYGGHHLGLGGCLRLLGMLRKPPKLILLTEFGEELVGHRAHLADAVKLLLPDPKAPVLPADVDLCIDLTNGTVKCTRCEEWHHFSKTTAIERETDMIGYVSTHTAGSSQRTCQWE